VGMATRAHLTVGAETARSDYSRIDDDLGTTAVTISLVRNPTPAARNHDLGLESAT
jgi:hypothetical protein